MLKIPALKHWHWPHLALLASIAIVATLAIRGDWPETNTLFAWLVFNVSLLAIAEHWRPFRHDWQPNQAALKRDASLWSMALLTDALVGAILASILITWAPGQSPWPLALQLLIGLPLAEFGSYWLHRWSHRGGWLWQVHLTHHRPSQINVANAVTVHPINIVYNKLARVLPLLALGLSPEAMLIIAMFELTQSLVTHANVAGSMGPFNWILGTAEQHRLHHSTDPAEAGNFGTSLPIWDQLFGTFRTGSNPKQVGVFDPSAYPGELQTCALLYWPFRHVLQFWPRRSRKCCGVTG